MKNTTLGIALLLTGMIVTWSAPAQQAKEAPAKTPEVSAAAAPAADQQLKLQTTCPVMGGAVDKKIYVDYEGKRIYLCCQGCVAIVQKDPAKYLKQLAAEGVILDPAVAIGQLVEPKK